MTQRLMMWIHDPRISVFAALTIAFVVAACGPGGDGNRGY